MVGVKPQREQGSNESNVKPSDLVQRCHFIDCLLLLELGLFAGGLNSHIYGPLGTQETCPPSQTKFQDCKRKCTRLQKVQIY